MISDSIKNKSKKEKATIKGREIAKLNIAKTKRDKYEIEIIKMAPIEKGVEIFIRAWNSKGEQIGFGLDGSVDIERFIFINPPILVKDDHGDIIRTYYVKESNKTIEYRYREDLKEAILQSLEHTISVKSQKFNDSKIVKDKIGNTTTTFYPDNDGLIGYNTGSATWSAAHDAATGTEATDTKNESLISDDAPRSEERSGDARIYRVGLVFDTSSIPDLDTIDSAVFSVYPNSINDGDNDGDDYLTVVDDFTPADPDDFATADYNQFGTTEWSAQIDLGDITATQYNNWTFNATGKSNINKTGDTLFGFREGHDILDHAMAVAKNSINMAFSDTAGTSSDPKLVVEHSGESTFIPKITII